MQYAFIAGTLIGLITGIISFFVVLRKSAFATHGLSHISLTGASGGVLIGLNAFLGQLIANLIAGLIMGLLGDRIKKNDVTVGIVLTFFLGLGAYFLFLYQNGYAGSIMSILFGNILSVTLTQIILLSLLAFFIIIVMLFVMRPLYFISIDPSIALSKGLNARGYAILFFIMLALTVTMACQIVGVLLVLA